MKVKRTERGWSGHFCRGRECLFRRNTLLESDVARIVVSTVGAMDVNGDNIGYAREEIGIGRYYETMAFHVDVGDMEFSDADVGRPIWFDSPDGIHDKYADNEANAMHEDVVAEITKRLAEGETYEN